jgi:NAD(P)H-nitrite reductase large subunit
VQVTGVTIKQAGSSGGEGSQVAASLVVVGVGARPNVDLAKAAGLELAGPPVGGVKVGEMTTVACAWRRGSS